MIFLMEYLLRDFKRNLRNFLKHFRFLKIVISKNILFRKKVQNVFTYSTDFLCRNYIRVKVAKLYKHF